jgi:hypothetical protein
MNGLSAALLVSVLSSTPVMTQDKVTALYPKIFGIKRDGLSGDIRTLPRREPLAALVNENEHYLLYLLTRWIERNEPVLRTLPTTQAEFEASYAGLLQTDPSFNADVMPLVSNFLRTKGVQLAAASKTRAPRVTWSGLTNVAVRFFYPDGVKPDGKLQSHVCVSLNGLRELPARSALTASSVPKSQGMRRDHAVEAFAYAAIMEEMRRPKHGLEAEYLRALKLANALELSSDETTRVQRAQGVVWGLMAQSRALKLTLADGYRRMRPVLAFELTPEGSAAPAKAVAGL